MTKCSLAIRSQVWARTLSQMRPWDVWYLFCQWISSAPFYSLVNKAMVSLEAVEEVGAGRTKQKSINIHFDYKHCWKMKKPFSPLYTVVQVASQWMPGPVACHGGTPHGHQRWKCRKNLSRGRVVCSGGLQSKETEIDDTSWGTDIRPYTKKHSNENTLMRLCWGHRKSAVEKDRLIDKIS